MILRALKQPTVALGNPWGGAASKSGYLAGAIVAVKCMAYSCGRAGAADPGW